MPLCLFLVFSLISWSTALSSGNPVSIRPPETSYKWQSYTFSPIPSLLKREVNKKILGCLLYYGKFITGDFSQTSTRTGAFFCYTNNHASNWTVCWKSCFLKSLSAHAQCSFTSVRVYVWVYFCFTELLGSPLKASVKQYFPRPISARTGMMLHSKHTYIRHEQNTYSMYRLKLTATLVWF